MAVRVTAMMPAYNAEATIVEAVGSVLGQEFDDLELIVVDDGSTDGTVELVRAVGDSRVRVIENPSNVGRGAAHNQAIASARGRLIAVCDADDISLPHRFGLQVRFLDENPSAAVVSGQIDSFGEWGGPVRMHQYPTSRLDIEKRFRRGHMAIAHPAAMFRREVVVAAGGYSSECVRAQDLELFLRLAGTVGIRALDECLVHYRTSARFPAYRYWMQNANYRRYAVYSARMRRMMREPGAADQYLGKVRTRARMAMEPVNYARCRMLDLMPSQRTRELR
ncbi:glycosyltransferase family 2 protein [Frankia sp. CNm7]|uniref:Glycosyltransferase family 2 protein n=1 Tax=Frankia nepalensis TaxID=1836974 RepID=A0A937RBK0_9ACTN|nr:glycosyltransferase family 2 protein [Frankia nepalensis]MBL7502676.1 glycosyltransferase family 2 protein [Frankia nepalensis]MBL7515532.1 glycosyltransferase family 2 protein [Frankia nepalensis]MBL7522789.1 glycosyltransferase family 2 protein [Frankia nepalensis]MBL7629061.1 glycosyltransferase family 2 protein [Frankia nepalensis]